jgi:hypothetical protein
VAERAPPTGGGYDVGSTNPGDWLNHTADIAQARTYTLHVRIATDVGGVVFHLAVEGQNVSGLISMPQTNGWQTWQTLDVPGVRRPPHPADGDGHRRLLQHRPQLQLVLVRLGVAHSASYQDRFSCVEQDGLKMLR